LYDGWQRLLGDCTNAGDAAEAAAVVANIAATAPRMIVCRVCMTPSWLPFGNDCSRDCEPVHRSFGPAASPAWPFGGCLRKKKPRFRGFEERVMGLEPTTFCWQVSGTACARLWLPEYRPFPRLERRPLLCPAAPAG
jgi:hypothetical protein